MAPRGTRDGDLYQPPEGGRRRLAPRKKAADAAARPEDDAVRYECGASIVSELNEIVLGFARAVQEERRRSEGSGGLAEAWRRAWAALTFALAGIERRVETASKGGPTPFAIRANFPTGRSARCAGSPSISSCR